MITVLIPTGRPIYGSMIGLEDESWVMRTLKSLLVNWKQEENFEVVFSDACHSVRDLAEHIGRWPFPVKVVKPESYWLNHGMWSSRSTFNAGIRAATGKYVLICNDCCEFPPGTLSRLEKEAEEGRMMALLYVYKEGGVIRKRKKDAPTCLTLEDALESGKWDDQNFVRCSRWRFMGGDPCFKQLEPPFEAGTNQVFGYGLFPLEDLYHINGADENADGDKGYDDFDIPKRLHTAGLLKSYLDPSFYVYENSHNGVDGNIFTWDHAHPVRCNQDLFEVLSEKGIYKANSYQLSEEECLSIMRGGGWAKRERHDEPYKVDRDAPVWKHQEWWMKNQPNFNL